MKEIAKEILIWHQDIYRDLPWKETDNPYFIWLSEIILQQTRVEQGRSYYLKFIKTFPTIHDLAKATEDTVLNLWQGLGYYSRARNLHSTAKFISNELKGQFPNTYSEILKLKGVGPYTAAAIASFAFKESVAVLDGNVFRVLSRIFDIDTDILSSKGQKEFSTLANKLLGHLPASEFNQAIMDFGALQCSPKPKCLSCPIQDICLSYKKDIVHLRPIKKKKTKKKKRYFHYYLITQNSKILLEKRSGKDIWKGLYQLPLIELNEKNNPIAKNFNTHHIPNNSLASYCSKQLLSHQEIHAYFYEILEFDYSFESNLHWFDFEEINTLGFPKTIVDFLKYKAFL